MELFSMPKTVLDAQITLCILLCFHSDLHITANTIKKHSREHP